MFNFALSNFRSFRDAGPVPIRPLTVVVGENSTGKSSFLAILRIALEMVHGDLNPNFNRDPFFLGAYDQIAHYRGGRGGRSASFGFTLTATVSNHRQRNLPSSYEASYRAHFVKAVSQPALAEIQISCDKFSVCIKEIGRPTLNISLRFPSWSGELPLPQRISETFIRFPSDPINLPLFLGFLSRQVKVDFSPELNMPEIRESEVTLFGKMWQLAAREFGPTPVAMAPVRTKPERTYNPIEDRPTPEGAHMPMVMAKTFFTNRQKWESLQSSLEQFGNLSGLFEQIDLKALGRSASDPFQIMVKMAGPRSNLIDVGYGVSQVLPIVVDILTSERAHNYLLQQPEVHLHPRGQAELASFLAAIVKNTDNWIVIETHSDYIIDRLRSDIRKKKHLSPDQVSILFLERVGIETKIHQMLIDENGNLQNAPGGYRQFTLEEERRLLGIDDEELASA
jgi:AAA ATPase domain